MAADGDGDGTSTHVCGCKSLTDRTIALQTCQIVRITLDQTNVSGVPEVARESLHFFLRHSMHPTHLQGGGCPLTHRPRPKPKSWCPCEAVKPPLVSAPPLAAVT